MVEEGGSNKKQSRCLASTLMGGWGCQQPSALADHSGDMCKICAKNCGHIKELGAKMIRDNVFFFCQFFITLSCDTFHLQSIEHWKILLKMITKRKMLHVSFFSSAIEWVVNELYSAITYCTFESNPLIMINQFAVTTKVVRAQKFALSTIVAVFIDFTVFIADG